MSFWDTSAIVPSFVQEASTDSILSLLAHDRDTAYWWSLPIECISGLWRLHREGRINRVELEDATRRMDGWLLGASCVEPSDSVRIRSRRLLALHPLKAADALHLAAALVWCGDHPSGKNFVCLDSRLRDAALREGFAVLPVQA